MGLAAAMVRTNLRISKYTRGRPGFFDWDNLHQYRLNLLLCHPVTVSGRTNSSAVLQSFQSFFSAIQNHRSRLRSRGLFLTREDGQLVTKCDIFQGDVLVTAEDENQESNRQTK
jgi:hypothetical protein